MGVEEKTNEEEKRKKENISEMKAKKIKLEVDDVGSKSDGSNEKETSEQQKTMIEGQNNELERKPMQIKSGKEKVLKKDPEIRLNVDTKESATNLAPENKKENIVDKVKI